MLKTNNIFADLMLKPLSCEFVEGAYPRYCYSCVSISQISRKLPFSSIFGYFISKMTSSIRKLCRNRDASTVFEICHFGRPCGVCMEGLHWPNAKICVPPYRWRMYHACRIHLTWRLVRNKLLVNEISAQGDPCACAWSADAAQVASRWR